MQRKKRFKPGETAGHRRAVSKRPPVAAFTPGAIPPATAAQEVRIRAFVAAYVADFNGTNAAMRIGISYGSAAQTARDYLRHPFCQWLLQQFLDAESEKSVVTRDRIIARLWAEANNADPFASSSRVAALRALARIKGMEVLKVEAKVDHSGGVMVVPAEVSPDKWEEMAVPRQTQLKQEAFAG